MKLILFVCFSFQFVFHTIFRLFKNKINPNYLYCLSGVGGRGRDVACMGDRRGAYRVLIGNSERKKQLGRPRSKLEDNIKMDLQEMG